MYPLPFLLSNNNHTITFRFLGAFFLPCQAATGFNLSCANHHGDHSDLFSFSVNAALLLWGNVVKGSSFLNVRMSFFPFSFTIANKESLGFRMFTEPN